MKKAASTSFLTRLLPPSVLFCPSVAVVSSPSLRSEHAVNASCDAFYADSNGVIQREGERKESQHCNELPVKTGDRSGTVADVMMGIQQNNSGLSRGAQQAGGGGLCADPCTACTTPSQHMWWAWSPSLHFGLLRRPSRLMNSPLTVRVETLLLSPADFGGPLSTPARAATSHGSGSSSSSSSSGGGGRSRDSGSGSAGPHSISAASAASGSNAKAGAHAAPVGGKDSGAETNKGGVTNAGSPSHQNSSNPNNNNGAGSSSHSSGGPSSSSALLKGESSAKGTRGRQVVKSRKAIRRFNRKLRRAAATATKKKIKKLLRKHHRTAATPQASSAGGSGGSGGVTKRSPTSSRSNASNASEQTSKSRSAGGRRGSSSAASASVSASSSAVAAGSSQSSGNSVGGAHQQSSRASGSSASALSQRRRRRRHSTPVAVPQKNPHPRQQKKKKMMMKTKGKKMNVCVLTSSYKGTDSETADLDNFVCTPAHYIKKENRHKYSFTSVEVEKNDVYRTVRELISSQKYDLFFNLCDGGRDEKRAGVEVVSALEDLNAAFTGTDSRCFEPSKIEMKLLVRSSGVRVPNYALLKKVEGLAKRCCHLRFPVIVKHITGYASVGIQKDNLCHNIDELRVKVTSFIARFHHALVEEFIVGREGTVLATADPSNPNGMKVFRPLMFSFLQGPHDFAYFDKKWKVEMDSKALSFLPLTDPAYPAIITMARNAFHFILNGVGYGRVDFRIDEKTNEPVFLEINPNCGMWYNEKDGGDYADLMVVEDSHWTHEKFFHAAAKQAMKHQAIRKPWYLVSQDKNGTFTARATRTVPANYCLFGDMQDPVPVIAKALYKLGGGEDEEDELSNTVGCVIIRGDGRPHTSVTIRHSCEPNMQFIHGRTLMCATKRPISTGEELSIDYGTLRDEGMPRFTCTCGTKNCRSIIFATPPTPRTIEVKAMKKLLREKKQQWLREKADREAEQILKKRTRAAAASSSSSSPSSVSSPSHPPSGTAGNSGSSASSS